MARATIKFNLDDPDDRMAHLAAVKAGDMAIVLWDINYNLKKRCHHKVEGSKKKLNNYDVIEMVFEEIYGLLDENHVVPDELTC